MSTLVEVAGAALLVSGSAIVAVAGIGVLRLADPFMRMHAATKAGVVGAGLVLLGIGLILGTIGAMLTALGAVFFLFLTSPIASHVMGRAAYISGAPLSPATTHDALTGVLPRRVSDSTTSRVAQRPHPANPTLPDQTAIDASVAKERAIIKAPNASRVATSRSEAVHVSRVPLATIRRVTVWLVGGPAQPAASRFALDLARLTGAEVTALSAIEETSMLQRGLAPASGLSWSLWLTDRQRLRSRAAAANALAEFEVMAAEARISTTQRHEEGVFPAVVARATGCDLLIVPGGVDGRGMPCAGPDELATAVSGLGLAPVLRVSRHPLQAMRVGLLIDDDPDSGPLAQTLVRTGLWREASVSMIAIGEHRPRVHNLVVEQADLLRAHGFEVGPGLSLGLDCSVENVDAVAQPLDVIVTRSLGRRRPSGWFEALRTDIHAIAARNCPLILLP